jgi:hypothetical protein
MSPYTEALELVKQNPGTSGQTGLAKAILSIYNPMHSFSAGEVLRSLDEHYTRVVIGIFSEYGRVGETAELREAGEWVYANFERLVELSDAMRIARSAVRSRWDNQSAAQSQSRD